MNGDPIESPKALNGRAVAFFDLASLGHLRFSATSREPESIEVPAELRSVLERLRAEDVRLGVIVRAGNHQHGDLHRLLERGGLSTLLSPELVVSGGAATEDPFLQALESAEHADDPSRCLFVGEDRDMRAEALRARMRVAPHARLARPALEGKQMLFVRVTAPGEPAGQPWRRELRELDFVPLHACGEGAKTLFAITVAGAAARLDDLGFAVDRLGAPDEPLASDLYLLRDDLQVRTGFLAEEGASRTFFGFDERASVLASSADGLYVAIPAGQSVEGYHFEEARHGHTEKLLPNPSLLLAEGGPATVSTLAGWDDERTLDREEREALAQVSAQRIGAHLSRYAGGQPADPPAAAILSRHIQHAHNQMAVESLAADLESLGEGALEVGLHAFHHEGQELFNVEAALQGSELDELVLITAHLDSTAQFSAGYDPTRDPAPGADDDASGLAGVLVVAEVLCGLARSRPPKRSIRFVLFNAEEHGLVGSKAYARDQAALGARIAAVFQMDMIGYNRALPRSFEVHAGFLPSAEVQQRSHALAERLGRAASDVSPELPLPQIYLSDESQGRDPAEGRSDHASFQLVGYPACATTEDFFAGPGSDVGEANPNYHMPSDTFVDLDYAADLARAVGAATWLSASL